MVAEQGAEADHTAKYGLSATMLGAVKGRTDIVRTLARAGATLDLRGSGAPGFEGKTALGLAIDMGHTGVVDTLKAKGY